MFKRALAASALLLSSSAFANIAVEVKNESRIYDVELTSKDYQTSRYSPNPQDTIIAKSSDRFNVSSNYPNVVRLVDFEYQYSDSSVYDAPRCHFRFVAVIDPRTGTMLPQKVIAENESRSYRDRAICTGKLDYFNVVTGDAKVTFTINRRKY
ncbi:hypothetical protein [Vibrio chagasii]|uniref:Uncharacterized protein n=1 Tax=Vibrio chagasii TaxID=170679 RepID=A0A7Y3YKA0_9VIBR|nr:hypothetical protein [Vibrio chagasii]NOH32026.1 hypothetical protein [Vibrio chagasii]